MRKLFLFVAMLCMSVVVMAADEVYDTNFALASNGSSATASSGNAAAAIDGNEGTRWESAQTDDETWTLDMGQARVFNTIKILWEGAYAKEFTLSYSNDGENWSELYVETNLTKAGWQTIEVAKTTAQYIQYHGTLRATGYGQSFFEFQVLLPGVSVLTKIELSAPAIAKIGEGVALNVKAFDQNNAEMEAEISYEITPADAGSVVAGVYVPAKIGNASIVAKNGTISSPAIEIFGYDGSNLALSTNIDNDNKVIAQSDFAPNGTNAFYAVDGNDGSVWQGSATNGTAEDEASRTFDAWFVVDLGAYYSIDLITIHFEGACSQEYHVDFSENNSVWATGYNYVGTAGINGRTDVLSTALLDNYQKVRYVRFWSTKAGTQWGMKMFEFQVFGREYAAPDDTEKPVMVSAELVSKTGTSAVIAVAATDNDEIGKYHVVDAAKGIDAKYAATNGQITITGLTGNTTYNFVITALDLAQNESDNSKTVSVTTDVYYTAPDAAATAPTWPAAQVKAIYSPTYSADCNFQDWGSGTVYAQEEFGKKYSVPASGYFGMDGFALNCLMMEKLHADIWIADDATLRLVPIYGGAGLNTDDTHGKMVNLTGGQWNSIDLDLATDYAGLNLASIFQFKIDNASNLTFWIGNAYFYRTTEIEDNEAPTNVKGSLASAGYFNAVLALSADDNLGVVNFSIKNGEEEVATGAGKAGDTIKVSVNGLLPNTEYNFSVIASDDKGNAAEAIAVAATTLAAPAPAPAPQIGELAIVPIFTDAVAGGPAITIGGWGQSTVVTEGELAEGDHVQYFSNMNYLGWELTPAVNATGMQHLHLDLYSTTMTSIKVTPISPGKEGIATVNLTSGEWTQADIDLSVYAINEIDWSNIFQFKFDGGNGGDLFVDNVYFYGPKGEGIENVTGEKANGEWTKVIENGMFYIIREGVKYNVSGQVVR